MKRLALAAAMFSGLALGSQLHATEPTPTKPPGSQPGAEPRQEDGPGQTIHPSSSQQQPRRFDSNPNPDRARAPEKDPKTFTHDRSTHTQAPQRSNAPRHVPHGADDRSRPDQAPGSTESGQQQSH